LGSEFCDVPLGRAHANAKLECRLFRRPVTSNHQLSQPRPDSPAMFSRFGPAHSNHLSIVAPRQNSVVLGLVNVIVVLPNGVQGPRTVGPVCMFSPVIRTTMFVFGA
jgi:hypothetical protein